MPLQIVIDFNGMEVHCSFMFHVEQLPKQSIKSFTDTEGGFKIDSADLF